MLPALVVFLWTAGLCAAGPSALTVEPDTVIQPLTMSGVTIGYFGGAEKPYFIGDINGIRISNKARSEFPVP